MMKILLGILLGLLTLGISQSYAEEIELEFPKFIDWGTTVTIHYEGQASPEFYGSFFLYDKDGELVQAINIFVEDDGSFRGSYQTAKNNSIRIFDEGTGYVSVYSSETLSNVPGAKFDSSYSLLTKKVPIKFFKPLQQAHPVKIINGEFVPNHLEIPVYDRIKFVPDCGDCYKLQITMYNNEIRNVRTELETFSFNVEGTYKISDIFEPVSELTIQVVFPDPLTTPSLETSSTNDLGIETISKPELEIGTESKLPEWVRTIFIWYAEDVIEEDELINALQFLIKEGIIKV